MDLGWPLQRQIHFKIENVEFLFNTYKITAILFWIDQNHDWKWSDHRRFAPKFDHKLYSAIEDNVFGLFSSRKLCSRYRRAPSSTGLTIFKIVVVLFGDIPYLIVERIEAKEQLILDDSLVLIPVDIIVANY